jgi:phosphohistidine phosphatase
MKSRVMITGLITSFNGLYCLPLVQSRSKNKMSCTTNEEDQREAARLQARLRDQAASKGSNVPPTASGSTNATIPNVTIADGAHKYVLMTAVKDNERQHFVVSRKGAAYHRDAAEPMVESLERSGYESIAILGGGRIRLDRDNATISIYGYSYGFGLADHALSKSIIQNDPRYEGYTITWSNEGY